MTLINDCVEAFRYYGGFESYGNFNLACARFDKVCEGRDALKDAEILEACEWVRSNVEKASGVTLMHARHFAHVTPKPVLENCTRLHQIKVLCLGLDPNTSEYAKKRARFEVIRFINDKQNMMFGHRLYHLKEYLMGSNIVIHQLSNTGYYGPDNEIVDAGLWAVLEDCDKCIITNSRDLKRNIKRELKSVAGNIGF